MYKHVMPVGLGCPLLWTKKNHRQVNHASYAGFSYTPKIQNKLLMITDLSNRLQQKSDLKGGQKKICRREPLGSCSSDWRPFLRRLSKDKAVDSAVRIPEKPEIIIKKTKRNSEAQMITTCYTLIYVFLSTQDVLAWSQGRVFLVPAKQLFRPSSRAYSSEITYFVLFFHKE